VSVAMGRRFPRFASTVLRQLQRGRQVEWSLRHRLDQDDLHALCTEVYPAAHLAISWWRWLSGRTDRRAHVYRAFFLDLIKENIIIIDTIIIIINLLLLLLIGPFLVAYTRT